jgi:hypothetical protein
MPAVVCSFPMRHAPRPGSPPGRAHTTDRAVPRRTRAGRGGRATTASPSSRLRHRGGLPIKPSTVPPSERHTKPPAAIAALALKLDRSRATESTNHLSTAPRPCCCSRTHALPSQEPYSPPNRAAAAAVASHRRVPAPAAFPPQLWPSPGPR